MPPEPCEITFWEQLFRSVLVLLCIPLAFQRSSAFVLEPVPLFFFPHLVLWRTSSLGLIECLLTVIKVLVSPHGVGSVVNTLKKETLKHSYPLACLRVSLKSLELLLKTPIAFRGVRCYLEVRPVTTVQATDSAHGTHVHR